MKTFAIALIMLANVSLFAQETKKEETKTEIYGFVRLDMFSDSHKGINAANEQFYLFPLYSGYDYNGVDVNKQLSTNFASMASRFGIRYFGPTLFNAKTVANIEGDFAGDPATFTAVLRLRQANVRFNWAHSALTIGQTWHPLWGGKVFPMVGNLNTGAPFQGFNRSPLIRFDYTMFGITLSGAAIHEFQYLSFGPKSATDLSQFKSDQYARNAALPELYFSAEYNGGPICVGAGLSLKQLKPLLYSVNGVGDKFVTNQKLQSSVAMLYGMYKSGLFMANVKTYYGQNMGYLLMPGGYGVTSVDDVTGDFTYTNYNHSISHINAVYGKKYQAGFFGGYTKNLGTNEALIDVSESPKTWGLFPQIQSMYRLAPHVAYNEKNFRLVLELEHTIATYGIGAMRLSDGLYDNSVDMTNNRILLMLTYFF
jgi:hypothetical protein